MNRIQGSDETERRKLLEAFTPDSISVQYQPKIDCRTKRIDGFEVLARWRHETFGFVSPELFIPLAEEGGLIRDLTGRVMDLSMSWFAALPGHENYRICINLSPVLLEDIALVADIIERARRHAIPHESLVIEVTETRPLNEPAVALEFVTRLRVSGFGVAIDDIGTGYASHRRLAELPFSLMKIDQAITRNAATSKSSRTLIASLVSLAHTFGLEVIGEGVEDRETLDYLIEVGCDLAQGYYIARPMPGERLESWLDDWNARHGPEESRH